MAYVKDRLFTPGTRSGDAGRLSRPASRFPCESMADHLFAYTPGWTQTVEYAGDDPRLPEPIRAFSRRTDVERTVIARRSSSAAERSAG